MLNEVAMRKVRGVVSAATSWMSAAAGVVSAATSWMSAAAGVVSAAAAWGRALVGALRASAAAWVVVGMVVGGMPVPVAGGAKVLHINGCEYAVDTVMQKHRVGPGVEYARYRLPDRPLDIYVLETDLTNPYVNLEVWNGGDRAFAGQCPSDRYAAEDRPGHDMVAAHNGDYYTVKKGETGMSRMGLIGAGEVIFNPTGKPLFVLDNQKHPYIGDVCFNGVLAVADTAVRIHTVNMLALEWEPETAANQLSLFTPAFGAALHNPSPDSRVAAIRPVADGVRYVANSPMRFRVVSTSGAAPDYPVDADGAVLYGVGESADFLAGLAEGAELTITLGVSMPRYPDVTVFDEAVGGSGHILMRDGAVCPSGNHALHPRTLIGVSRDGKRLYHVVVDGRSESSAGIELEDEGRLLQWLGAWEGLNLDGGGSSSLVVNGDIVNRTSDGHERAVGNGVIIYSTAPVDDRVADIAFAPRSYTLSAGESFIPAVYGYNRYGLLKDRALGGVSFSCDPQIGHIGADGRFIASAVPATGYIYATYNGATTRQRLTVR